jgi:phage/plasmid primase-like uncharacterized protein
MQHATYTLDNSQQTPQQFAALSPQELAQRRNHLACPGCSGHTFFRSETRDGRAPCFCGHHQDGCEYAAVQSVAKNSGQRSNRDTWSPHGQRIVVDLA